VCRYGVDSTSTGRLVSSKDEQLMSGLHDVQYNGQCSKDEQLMSGLHDVQYNGQCHTQLLQPQYFVLDKHAVDAAN